MTAISVSHNVLTAIQYIPRNIYISPSLAMGRTIGAILRDHFWYGLSQREMTLLCNVISHWPSPYPEWSLSPSEATWGNMGEKNSTKNYDETATKQSTWTLGTYFMRYTAQRSLPLAQSMSNYHIVPGTKSRGDYWTFLKLLIQKRQCNVNHVIAFSIFSLTTATACNSLKATFIKLKPIYVKSAWNQSQENNEVFWNFMRFHTPP